MTRYLLMLILAVSYLCASADFPIQGTYSMQFVSVDDPSAMWTQYEEKNAKALLRKNILLLESKNDGTSVVSCTEFPLNPKDEDFVAEFIFQPLEWGEDKSVGIVFDYKNERNYSLISLSKKSFLYQTCEKGEFSVIKRGVYKLVGRKFQKSSPIPFLADKNVYDVKLIKQHGTMYLLINDVEMARFKNIEINEPSMGFYAGPRSKLAAFGISYSVVSYDENEE